MFNPDSAIPDDDFGPVALGQYEMESEQFALLAQHSNPCTGFSMAPVMSVFEGHDPDAPPMGVERKVLVMMATEEGASSFTLPTIAFAAFVSMAVGVYENMHGSVVDRVVDMEAAIDDTVAEFRRDLGLDENDG